MSKRCENCAFTKGTRAAAEPENHLKGLLCVLAPHPFYCHESTDWKNPAVHRPMSRERLRALDLKICEGWRDEVRDLNQTGYYDENPVITKAFGTSALETLADISAVKDAATKNDLWRQLHHLADGLSKKWDKFRNKQ